MMQKSHLGILYMTFRRVAILSIMSLIDRRLFAPRYFEYLGR